MSMMPEIRMVDRLDGKEFKLGEYEHDEETGILYVGTHGTVFPGGSGTTGGGSSGGGSSGSGGILDGFKDGIGCELFFRLYPRLTTEVNAKANVGVSVETDKSFKILPVYHDNVLADFANTFAVTTQLTFN